MRITKYLRVLALALVLSLPLVRLAAPVATYAATADLKNSVCTGAGATVGENGCDTNSNGLMTGFQTIANTLIFLVGAIAVIMVIIGALRYVLSGGDSAGIKSAKDTVMYALIGVVVAILAYALVNYVATRFA